MGAKCIGPVVAVFLGYHIDGGLISGVQAGAAILVDRPFVRRMMFAAGYDGFVYSNETDGGGDSWIALDAGQIRPAFRGECPD